MSSKSKLCVLISGNGSNLQAIIDHIDDGKLNAEISLVISNKPNAYGLTRAENAGIRHLCLDHSQYEDRESYDQALADTLSQENPDCIVLAGFMRILTPEFVNKFSGKLLNIHPSLLPKYKGLNTHQRAIDNGDEEHGVSVHFVTPELDGGPVIIQSRVPIFEEDTAGELAERVQEQERRIYPLVLEWVCDGRLTMRDNKAILDDNPLPESGYASE
ncbi:phosphoribosylglycinamide formyltransferase [Alteromonas sp. KUL49]|uniref:phosphoribosylglycinamide formyltransferase n=1 Tax=Alteromonas sp. KUL49 TaxID=2480798 RepID=UPI00102F0F4A|nr:phosphoribosylglycinamide formyltransferase [Alteromonas sp. KUL49]TAP40718.1 phosphoribosylglycinamide formyltransferase [Alteromonas sp. KUL49]GEA10886.1 phosphoribosylglycinamide formyltransferase [Alteromonas sp. KUL49]